MMLKHPANILIPLLFLISAINVPAQNLPSFRVDSRIRRGSLPNGVEFYLVSNDWSKGYADFCLIQKNGGDPDQSRPLLSHLDNFGSERPYRFLADKGVGYGPEGFVSYENGASVFSFRDVPTFDASAADSTLLVIFDMIRAVPCPQAVVISGDIDAAKLADRMYVLSMTVPRLPETNPEEPYSWKPEDGPRCLSSSSDIEGVSEVRIRIASPRTPPEFMNTPQPLVTGMFVTELERILSQRLRNSFRSEGVPLGGIDIRYESSSVREGDEICEISLTTDGESSLKAIETAASVLGGIDFRGVTQEEYNDARNHLIFNTEGVDVKLSNRQYADRCVNAYLYGASLVSPAEIYAFVSRRRLAPEKELELFNNFSSALLDSRKSISLECITPGSAIDTGMLRETFLRTWDDTVRNRYSYSVVDTLCLMDTKSKARIKLKSSVPDPITGGQLWTFSNGMKVIFKKADIRDRFCYGLMIKGGTPVIQGISPGEAGFASDMFRVFDVAGMSPDEFSDMLRTNGISFNPQISVSDMRITGSAPVSRLSLLLKSLLSLSCDRNYNRARFDYYRKCEEVRLKTAGISAEDRLDRMISPDYRYSEIRNPESLGRDLPTRVGRYLDWQFSRINDGILVIVGDFKEEELQKILIRSLGNFNVGKSTQVRSRVSRDTRQGWYTSTFPGEACVAMSYSIRNPFSMDGYMTFRIASVALQKEIVKALAEEGMYAEFKENIEFYPEEEYTMTVKCRPCNIDGLPSVVVEQRLYRALDAVRAAVNRLSSTEITPSELQAYKAELKNVMTSYYSTPEAMVDAVMVRYSAGRDIVSLYGNYIDGVSVGAVKAVLSSLNDGARMEAILK